MSILDLRKKLYTETGQTFVRSLKTDLAVLSFFDREDAVQLQSNETRVVTRTGPYCNIDLSSNSFTTFLRNTFALPRFEQKSEKLWLEYFSPQVAKSLHIGHVRNVNTGVAFENLLSLVYPSMVTDSHLGDWGVPFGIILWAIKKTDKLKSFTILHNDVEETVDHTLKTSDPSAYYMKLYIWGNQQENNTPDWKTQVRAEFHKLENHDEENTRLWSEMIALCKDANMSELSLLNMKQPDFVLGESVYEEEMKKLSAFFEQNGLWKSDGTARFIDYKDFDSSLFSDTIQTKLKTLVHKDNNELGRGYCISSTGYSTYLFRDIAARIVWARDYGMQKMITLTDSSQEHHFNQLIVYLAWLAQQNSFVSEFGSRVAERLASGVHHYGYGRVILKSGKMSTRKGNFVTAREVIESVLAESRRILCEKNPNIPSDLLEQNSNAIARAALKWNDLKISLKQDTTFDPLSILSFEGNTGVYQLYTYARLRSILSKNQPVDTQSVHSVLAHKQELALLRMLYQAPLIVEDAINSLEPQKITNYLHSLAQSLNSWYSSTHITNLKDHERKHTLLALCHRSSEVLQVLNQLLGITVVETL